TAENVYAAATAPASLYCQHTGTFSLISTGPNSSLAGTATKPTVTESSTSGGSSMLILASGSKSQALGSTSAVCVSLIGDRCGVSSSPDTNVMITMTTAATTMPVSNTSDGINYLLRVELSHVMGGSPLSVITLPVGQETRLLRRLPAHR